MKFIELFAGIGGLGFGLQQAGMECVGYVEMDKFAHQAYQILHDPKERMWNAYDVRDVTDDDIRSLRRERGDIQLIAAGFPCQSFSIAGRREGFADVTRGTLFFEIIRFASILRPQYLLLENVTGLLNHDGGATFETILGALDELGYECEWQVHNSAGWIPQNRERIFIVGHLRGSSTRKIFPFGRENSNAIKIVGKLGEGYREINQVLDTSGISTCLKTMQGGGLEPKVMVIGNVNPSGNGMNGQVFHEDGLSPTLTTNKGEGVKVLTEPRAVLTPDRMEKRQNGRRMKEPGEPMFTLTAQDLHGVEQSKRIRKLTPLECFKLQTYPIEWYVKLKLFRHPEYIEQVDISRNDITNQVLTIIQDNGLKEGISDSQLYKMAGNGVTSVVAYEIGKRLIKAVVKHIKDVCLSHVHLREVMRMIKLTLWKNDIPTWINPDHITTVTPLLGGKGATVTRTDDFMQVIESAEEIVQKIINYKLGIISYSAHQKGVVDISVDAHLNVYGDLKREHEWIKELAGLEVGKDA